MIEFDMGDLDGLARDVGSAGRRVKERAQTIVRKTGHDVVTDAQQLVPVDTGALKNSIGVDFDPDDLGFEAGPTMEYGPFVEWGTSRMPPQPYMTPAFDRRIEPAMEAVEQISGQIL